MKKSPVTVAGGIRVLLQQAGAWNWLDTSVALFDCSGGLLYHNPAAELLTGRLYHDDTARADRRGLISLAAFTDAVRTTCKQLAGQALVLTLYYDRNIPVQLTLILRPVIDQADDRCEGVMVTIGEEQVDFNGRHLARAQAEAAELKARIHQLSVLQRENEHHIRVLLSEIPIPLIVFNSERRLTQINSAAESLFGVVRRYAVGKACDHFMRCFADCGNCCPVFDRGEHMNLDEMALPGDSGVSRHLLRTAVPLVEAGQAVVVEVFVDISDRKKMEQQAARYRRELETLVAQRTAKLRDYNRELESFSYTVSHDLRTPLRAIDGFSYALLEDYRDVLDEQAMDYIDKVRSAAQRMGLLIDDLLKLSRVTRHPLRRESVEISRIAGGIIDELRSAEPGRRVQADIQPGITVEADAGLVQALLANLLNNAWKFTTNQPEACIELGSTVTDDGEVLYVRDNGIGFSMEYADKLFQPFHVLHPRSLSGSGIGLATVERIIQRHGGRIWAESVPGEGAVFYFQLG